jgi:hypothetical protein
MERTTATSSPARPRAVLRRGTVRVAACAGVAALVLAAIPALAADTATTVVTYYGCVTNKTGALKIVSRTTSCGSGKHKISWNNIGPRGPQGPKGPQGPSGITNAYVDESTTTMNITISSANYTPVATVKLPAGNWLMTATVDLAFNNSGGASADSVNCDLGDGAGDEVDQASATMSIDPTFDDGTTTLTLSGDTTNSGTATLSCIDDTDISPSPTASSVVLTATQVNNLHVSFSS